MCPSNAERIQSLIHWFQDCSAEDREVAAQFNIQENVCKPRPWCQATDKYVLRAVVCNSGTFASHLVAIGFVLLVQTRARVSFLFVPRAVCKHSNPWHVFLPVPMSFSSFASLFLHGMVSLHGPWKKHMQL